MYRYREPEPGVFGSFRQKKKQKPEHEPLQKKKEPEPPKLCGFGSLY